MINICQKFIHKMKRHITLIFVFLLTKYATAYYTMDDMKATNTDIYLEVKNEDNFQSEATLWYPRGDKQKLARISKLWKNYYECSSRLATILTPSGQLPSTITMAYVGATAKLHCRLCVAPGELAEVAWSYAESLQNLTFIPMEDNDRTVEEYGNISIYHVKPEDAGVYRCQIGDSVGGLMVLEVVDNEKYTVVKPLSSQGPYPSPIQPINDFLALFSSWSPWSECSSCGRVGRRRRYGICYIRFANSYKNETLKVKQNNTINIMNKHNRQGILKDITANIFEAFPEGIPCRSRLLPNSIKNMQVVQQRRNEIMIAMCKVACIDTIFEVRSRGVVLERANNSAGVYSLGQRLPPQPPPPSRDIVFASFGEPLVLSCPGTTLRDMPVTWQVGTRLVVPRHLDRGSEGRVHLNARDQLVFATVLYPDANLYSCWQGNNLAGSTKVVVWRSGPRAVLLVVLLAGGLILRVADRLLRAYHRR